MKIMQTQLKFHWMGILLIVMLLGSLLAFADPSLRYQRASGRVERRDERASGRIENQQVRSGERIERRDERTEGRIENQQERSGKRIERRDERITNRIDRRDMLFSLPSDATPVTLGGTRCYKINGVIYKPAFYEGETVYVNAEGE